jgi:hypothetical protein
LNSTMSQSVMAMITPNTPAAGKLVRTNALFPD